MVEDSKEDEFARPTLLTSKESTWFCSLAAKRLTLKFTKQNIEKKDLSFHPQFD